MSVEPLVVEKDASVLRVTVNRPEVRNALSLAVLAGIETTFRRHADDAGLRLCILRGAGDRSFAAGGDIKELASLRTSAEATRMAEDAKRALAAIRDMPVPVLAALNGDALGGGAELALACDFRVAASQARIGFIQGRLNISTGWGGGVDLAQRVGPGVALRLMARAELLSATEALRIGLIDDVAGDGESLDEAVRRFAEPILAQSPQVLRAFKAVVRSGSPEVETRRFAETWVHEDHWKAVAKFTGRKS